MRRAYLARAAPRSPVIFVDGVGAALGAAEAEGYERRPPRGLNALGASMRLLVRVLGAEVGAFHTGHHLRPGLSRRACLHVDHL